MRPFGLLKILKGAYGLTEAPRLWCLKAKALLEGIGAQELKIARAVFIFREKEKQGTAGLVAILRLYVDDGLLFGDPKDPRFLRTKKHVDSVFNIKHWKSLGPQSEKYLGMQWQTVTEGGAESLCLHVDDRIDNRSAPSEGPAVYPEPPLDAEELAQYRSLLAQARWLVNQVVLELVME